MKRELNGILKRNLKDKVLYIVEQYDVMDYSDCVITICDYYTKKYEAYEGVILQVNSNAIKDIGLTHIIVFIDNNDDIEISYQDNIFNINHITESKLLNIDDVIEKAISIKFDLEKLIRYSNKEDMLEQLEYVKNKIKRIYTFIDQNF